MTRRLRALVAVVLMLGLLATTPGTANGEASAKESHGFVRVPLLARNHVVAPRRTAIPLLPLRVLRHGAVSRDWLRSPLIVAPPLLAAVAAQPTVPSAPPASPTLGTTQGPAGSGESKPAGSSAANALPRTAAESHDTTSVQGAAQAYARTLVNAAQWPCLRRLWQRESGWRANANNPQSTAFGIAQLLTETSSDWRQQIQRGIAYIGARYGGSACAALSHSNETGWY